METLSVEKALPEVLPESTTLSQKNELSQCQIGTSKVPTAQWDFEDFLASVDQSNNIVDLTHEPNQGQPHRGECKEESRNQIQRVKGDGTEQGEDQTKQAAASTKQPGEVSMSKNVSQPEQGGDGREEGKEVELLEEKCSEPSVLLSKEKTDLHNPNREERKSEKDKFVLCPESSCEKEDTKPSTSNLSDRDSECPIEDHHNTRDLQCSDGGENEGEKDRVIQYPEPSSNERGDTEPTSKETDCPVEDHHDVRDLQCSKGREREGEKDRVIQCPEPSSNERGDTEPTSKESDCPVEDHHDVRDLQCSKGGEREGEKDRVIQCPEPSSNERRDTEPTSKESDCPVEDHHDVRDLQCSKGREREGEKDRVIQCPEPSSNERGDTEPTSKECDCPVEDHHVITDLQCSNGGENEGEKDRVIQCPEPSSNERGDTEPTSKESDCPVEDHHDITDLQCSKGGEREGEKDRVIQCPEPSSNERRDTETTSKETECPVEDHDVRDSKCSDGGESEVEKDMVIPCPESFSCEKRDTEITSSPGDRVSECLVQNDHDSRESGGDSEVEKDTQLKHGESVSPEVDHSGKECTAKCQVSSGTEEHAMDHYSQDGHQEQDELDTYPSPSHQDDQGSVEGFAQVPEGSIYLSTDTGWPTSGPSIGMAIGTLVFQCTSDEVCDLPEETKEETRREGTRAGPLFFISETVVKGPIRQSHIRPKCLGTQFACRFCKRVGLTKKFVNKHAMCHLSYANYICVTCGMKFRHKATARLHLCPREAEMNKWPAYSNDKLPAAGSSKLASRKSKLASAMSKFTAAKSKLSLAKRKVMIGKKNANSVKIKITSRKKKMSKNNRKAQTKKKMSKINRRAQTNPIKKYKKLFPGLKELSVVVERCDKGDGDSLYRNHFPCLKEVKIFTNRCSDVPTQKVGSVQLNTNQDLASIAGCPSFQPRVVLENLASVTLDDNGLINKTVVKGPIRYVTPRRLKNKQYRCGYCRFQDSDIVVVEAHVRTHVTFNNSFVCLTCYMDFKNEHAARRHRCTEVREINPTVVKTLTRQKFQESRTGKGGGKDSSTGEDFDTGADRKSDKIINKTVVRGPIRPLEPERRDKNWYACRYCMYKAETRQAVVVHSQVHVCSSRFACLTCSKRYNSRNKASQHFCSNAYRVHPFLAKSLAAKHKKSEKRRKSFTEMEFVSSTVVRGPVEKIEPFGLNQHQYSCRYCVFQDTNRDIVLGHAMWHQSDSDFVCLTCGFGFDQRAKAQSHQCPRAESINPRVTQTESSRITRKRKPTGEQSPSPKRSRRC